jgi:hypothetical protein
MFARHFVVSATPPGSACVNLPPPTEETSARGLHRNMSQCNHEGHSQSTPAFLHSPSLYQGKSTLGVSYSGIMDTRNEQGLLHCQHDFWVTTLDLTKKLPFYDNRHVGLLVYFLYMNFFFLQSTHFNILFDWFSKRGKTRVSTHHCGWLLYTIYFTSSILYLSHLCTLHVQELEQNDEIWYSFIVLFVILQAGDSVRDFFKRTHLLYYYQ